MAKTSRRQIEAYDITWPDGFPGPVSQVSGVWRNFGALSGCTSSSTSLTHQNGRWPIRSLKHNLEKQNQWILYKMRIKILPLQQCIDPLRKGCCHQYFSSQLRAQHREDGEKDWKCVVWISGFGDRLKKVVSLGKAETHFKNKISLNFLFLKQQNYKILLHDTHF